MSSTNHLTNQVEQQNFLKTATMWQNSVSPKIMPRVFWASFYGACVFILSEIFPSFSLSITPFEYTGALLGALLVIRVNSGLERWMDARKIWGNIVNQSRNLALVVSGYTNISPEEKKDFLRWVSAFPRVMKNSLRNNRNLSELSALLSQDEIKTIESSEHMPSYVAKRIIQFLKSFKSNGLDSFVFYQAEVQRGYLIDAIGACERIRGTPIPLALAIKIRRFILLFLMLLPLALVDRAGWWTPLIVALIAYPLFSLDEIGLQLQNPFEEKNISHLPLNVICETIERNIL